MEQSEHTAPRDVDVEPVLTEPAATPAVPVFDVGDRVFVCVWRKTDFPRPGEAPGFWEVFYGRVVGLRRDGAALSYEAQGNPPQEDDQRMGSPLRWAPTTHVFDSYDAAQAATQKLKNPG